MFHRFLTFCYLAVFHLWLLVCPSTLSHDWQMGSIPLVTSLSDYRNLASCLLFVSCFWVGYKILNDIDVSVGLCRFTWILATNYLGMLIANKNTIRVTRALFKSHLKELITKPSVVSLFMFVLIYFISKFVLLYKRSIRTYAK